MYRIVIEKIGEIYLCVELKKDSIYIKSTLLGAGVNVIANLIFIPRYGAVGAAIGTIFAEASVALYQTFKVRKEMNISKYFVNSSLYIIPAICMYLCIIALRNITENIMLTLLMQVILGGITYVILSGIVLWFVDKDMRSKIGQLVYKVKKV